MQWDYGQVLSIKGLDLPKAVEIHFCVYTDSTTIPAVGITTDDHTDVEIPDGLLRQDRELRAYVYVADLEQGKTVRTVNIPIQSRQKPEIPHTPEDTEVFREAIKAVNNSADRAETAANTSDQNAKKTAEDRVAIAEMVETVSGIEQQVQDVKKYAGKAETAASNAALSEQKAKESETAALQAKADAETAKGSAETAAGKTAEDRTAVESAKEEVLQAKQQVSTDRAEVEAVERKVAQMGNAIPQAVLEGVQAVGSAGAAEKQGIVQAGTEQKSAVESAGTKAVEDINLAKKTATDAVDTAKTGAIKAVQAAAQEIVADRQQIGQNKEEVARLKEALKALDNVVTLEKSVELIQYMWTIFPINIKSGDVIIIKNPNGLYLPARTLSALSETSKVEEFNINSDKEYIFKATKDAVGIAFYQETSPIENIEVIRYGMDKDVTELRTKVDIIANYNVEKRYNDFANYENAYVDANGELASTMSWRTTDYIECASIVDRKIRIYCKQLPNVQYISYYNKYKCHIGGIVGTKNMYVTENLVIPVNAHYIRISFLEDNAQYYSYDVSRQLESAMAIQKTSNPLYGKKIACTGDSITAATDSVPGNGYADLIAKGNGATVSNHAIWGAVLAQGKTNADGTPKGCIYDTIAQMPADADVVLMSGGINDADYWNEPSYWGTMTGDYTSALDTKTFAGALEAMCKDALLKWAGKPIIYVIEHKMTNNFNSDYGKHFEEVEYPLIKKILEKWGISCVDLYKGMPSLSFVHDYKKRYSVDNKGVHPNVEGYLKFYVPRVESEIIRLLR